MPKTESEPSHDERVASGKLCKTCGSLYPGGVNHTSGPIDCPVCRFMAADDDEVSHSSHVRCPKCGHIEKAHDETMESPTQTCENCDTDYNVEVEVDITYISPPRSIEAAGGKNDVACPWCGSKDRESVAGKNYERCLACRNVVPKQAAEAEGGES